MMFARLLTVLLALQPAQAAFEYAAVCLPTHNYGETSECHIKIVSAYTAFIQIDSIEETFDITLPAGSLYTRQFSSSHFPFSGAEDKAIRIQSDVEIQVLVYKSAIYEFYNDAYMVPSLEQGSNEYLTSAYYRYDTFCTTEFEKQFYLVSSFYDGTFINVTQQDGTWYNLELQSYGTFVQTTRDEFRQLASGTRITSSHPISVVSGNLCVRNPLDFDTNFYGTYVSGVRGVEYLGREYVVPRIISEVSGSPGYSISIVASEDNTTVTSDEEVRLLNEGETAIFEYALLDRSIFVRCSQDCLVVQYSKPTLRDFGLFMQNILADKDFSLSRYFTTLNLDLPSYMSLVVKGNSTGDDLLLNGTSLGYLNWSQEHGYSTAEMTLPRGTYELISVNEQPFTAYIYVHQEQNESGFGAGYVLLPTDVNTTATPPPSTPGPLPQHTARVHGEAFAEDGLDISPQCAVEHLKNLNSKTKQMVVEVNQAILSKNICVDTEDILVISGNAAMHIQGSDALLTMDHSMSVQLPHVIREVPDCAEDVALYLSNLSNWQQPIFPDVLDCSRLNTATNFNVSGSFWSCDNQLGEDLAGTLLNNLSYESEVSEVLNTADGSILDPGCTQAYSSEATTKTTAMLDEISSALRDSGCEETVTPMTQASSFLSLGSQAYFLASFIYVPSQSATFDEFLMCMQLVHEFSLKHENWSPGSQPGAPFLPVPPGCPALEHEGPTLDDEGGRWTCVGN